MHNLKSNFGANSRYVISNRTQILRSEFSWKKELLIKNTRHWKLDRDQRSRSADFWIFKIKKFGGSNLWKNIFEDRSTERSLKFSEIQHVKDFFQPFKFQFDVEIEIFNFALCFLYRKYSSEEIIGNMKKMLNFFLFWLKLRKNKNKIEDGRSD